MRSLRKEVIYLSGVLIFTTVTKGTPLDILMWKPAWIIILAPKDCIYLHTVKGAKRLASSQLNEISPVGTLRGLDIPSATGTNQKYIRQLIKSNTQETTKSYGKAE